MFQTHTINKTTEMWKWRNHWPRYRTLTATAHWAHSIRSAPRTPVLGVKITISRTKSYETKIHKGIIFSYNKLLYQMIMQNADMKSCLALATNPAAAFGSPLLCLATAKRKELFAYKFVGKSWDWLIAFFFAPQNFCGENIPQTGMNMIENDCRIKV